MRLPFALLLGLTCAFRAQAHRLDEYLQAARIGVETNRVEVEIDLTPGVEVASRVMALIDSDRDGRITEKEAYAYAARLLAAAKLELDGGARTLRLVSVKMTSQAAMEIGLGMIRVKATADIPTLKPGPHQIRFENSHASAISVYLVNALLPSNAAICITKQSRDELQRQYQMDFEVRLPSTGGPGFLLPAHE